MSLSNSRAASRDETKQKSVGYWSQQLKQGSIIAAVRSHSAEARRFFGALPAMRQNELELAVIIDAHKILKMSDAQISRSYDKLRSHLLEVLHQQEPQIRSEILEEVSLLSQNYPARLREEARLRLKHARGR